LRNPRRRRAFAAVGVLVVVLAVAGTFVGRRLWKPHYRPSLASGERYGIDVSHYQGVIDWQAVAADGITFAYIKATEAGSTVDETFASNWSLARSAGIEVGAYHFFTLCRDGTDQAANFLRTVPLTEASLPPAVDLEFPNNCSDRPAPATVQHELRVFLDEVEDATGQPVLLYVEDAFDDVYGIRSAFDGRTWQRSLFERPADERWAVWQCSDVADVDGVHDGVDLNVMQPDFGSGAETG